MADQKVTKMILKVDLQCCRCYEKIKKVLCKFPQIRDQVYDEKKNTIEITVVCFDPKKIKQKIICKAGDALECIKIENPPPPPPPRPTQPHGCCPPPPHGCCPTQPHGCCPPPPPTQPHGCCPTQPHGCCPPPPPTQPHGCCPTQPHGCCPPPPHGCCPPPPPPHVCCPPPILVCCPPPIPCCSDCYHDNPSGPCYKGKNPEACPIM